MHPGEAKGPKDSFCLRWSPRTPASGRVGQPPQVWSLKGTRGLAASVPPVDARLAVSVRRAELILARPGRLLQRGVADHFFLPPAGPGEAVPEGLQRGRILWGWRGFLPVQRVCALPGGTATAAHPYCGPDKAGALGLGPASVPTRGCVALMVPPRAPETALGSSACACLVVGRRLRVGLEGPKPAQGVPGSPATERGTPEARLRKDC